MNSIWGWLATISGFATGAVVLGDMVNTEIQGRLDRLPRVVMKLASRRVRSEMRDDLLEEWSAELDEVLRRHRAHGLPITRLVVGIKFAAGLFKSAAAISRELGGMDAASALIGRHETPSSPDGTVRYSIARTCAAAGITLRQLEYWGRTGLVSPPFRSATSKEPLYRFKDVLLLKVVKRLLDTGVSLVNIRVAAAHLQSRTIDEMANSTLLSDGNTVYECRSAEEVVDLLAGGQGIFGIAVAGAVKELSHVLAPGSEA